MQNTLAELERYYDAVPRLSARAEDFGPLTLFVRDSGGYPFYARPTLGSQEPVTAQHIEAVRARQREFGIPETFEWVHEISPGLTTAARQAGLEVAVCPLLALPVDADGTQPSEVQFLSADSPALGSAIAVQRLSFSEGGTAQGVTGTRELADEIAKATADGTIERAQTQLRSQATYLCAVVDSNGNALSAGQHNPVGDVTEIVGVATLPAARRRGLGTAVTAGLIADARSRGITTVFLSAADEDVARVYQRLGFQRVGTAMIVS